MHSTTEIIEEACDLPVDERVIVTDALLKSLNAPDPEIEREWLDEVKRRIEDLHSGRVKGIPGEEVMAKVRKMLAR